MADFQTNTVPGVENIGDGSQFVPNLDEIEAGYTHLFSESQFCDEWARGRSQDQQGEQPVGPDGQNNVTGAEPPNPPNWDDCPQHNEGVEDDQEDEDDDVVQFISLASMCRDEQLFCSYLDEVIWEREQCAAEGVGNDDCGENTGAGEGQEAQAEQVRPSTRSGTRQRTFSRVMPNRRETAREQAEAADMLNYLANVGVQETEDQGDDEEVVAGCRRNIRWGAFNPTDELPEFQVGDVYGDRELIRETLRQYAVMTKRDIHIKINDGKRLRLCAEGIAVRGLFTGERIWCGTQHTMWLRL